MLVLSGSDTADLYAALQAALTEYKVLSPGLFPWIPTASITILPLIKRSPTTGKCQQSLWKLCIIAYLLNKLWLLRVEWKTVLPVAGKVLLCHLDCDVTLLASPVKIQ